MRTHEKMIMAGILVLCVLAGCSRDGGILSPGGNTAAQGPATPDELIIRLGQAYAERNLDAYAALLADDFVFSMRACGVNDLGRRSTDTMWGREEELTIARRMFSGKGAVNSAGKVIPALESVAVEQCELLIPWEKAGEDGRPEVLRAVYDMRVRFVFEGGRTMLVDGPTTFFAAPVADQSGRITYKLRGWVDQG